MGGVQGRPAVVARLSGTRQEDRGGCGKLASLCRLINEHGDAIEADLLRYYRIDLLDFYRGTLSIRRLAVLVNQLPAESATSRAVNDGHIPWGELEHLVADQWALWAKTDHPTRAEAEAKTHTEAKRARVIELKAKRARSEKYKRTAGLEEPA